MTFEPHPPLLRILAFAACTCRLGTCLIEHLPDRVGAKLPDQNGAISPAAGRDRPP